MNEIMKTLTTITILFMPMSFIAGLFGMNFFMPRPSDAVWEMMQRPVFMVVLFSLIVTPYLLYLWMRRRTWI
jgi:magnesium transporter